MRGRRTGCESLSTFSISTVVVILLHPHMLPAYEEHGVHTNIFSRDENLCRLHNWPLPAKWDTSAEYEKTWREEGVGLDDAPPGRAGKNLSHASAELYGAG